MKITMKNVIEAILGTIIVTAYIGFMFWMMFLAPMSMAM